MMSDEFKFSHHVCRLYSQPSPGVCYRKLTRDDDIYEGFVKIKVVEEATYKPREAVPVSDRLLIRMR